MYTLARDITVSKSVAYAVVSEPSAFGLVDPDNPVPGFLPYGNRVELFIGTFVGAITFSRSVIAFGKLSGKYKFRMFQGAPVVYAGQHLINLFLALGMLGFGVIFFLTQSWLPFIIKTLIAFVLGVLIIIPIGGADMPVVRVDAQLVLGLGGGGHRLLAEQSDADHLGIAGGLIRCDPVVDHVSRDEPFVLQRDSRRLRQRSVRGCGRWVGGTACG